MCLCVCLCLYLCMCVCVSLLCFAGSVSCWDEGGGEGEALGCSSLSFLCTRACAVAVVEGREARDGGVEVKEAAGVEQSGEGCQSAPEPLPLLSFPHPPLPSPAFSAPCPLLFLTPLLSAAATNTRSW